MATVEGLPLEKRGDFGLNVFNSRAVDFWRQQGLDSVTVSFELRHQQVRELRKYLPCEGIVYGRLPLMITENWYDRQRRNCRGDKRLCDWRIISLTAREPGSLCWGSMAAAARLKTAARCFWRTSWSGAIAA